MEPVLVRFFADGLVHMPDWMKDVRGYVMASPPATGSAIYFGRAGRHAIVTHVDWVFDPGTEQGSVCANVFLRMI